jgi:hypothetical protein
VPIRPENFSFFAHIIIYLNEGLTTEQGRFERRLRDLREILRVAARMSKFRAVLRLAAACRKAHIAETARP